MSYNSFNPNKGKRNLKLATFDIETTNWINPYYVSFYDGIGLFRFEGDNCISDFLKKVIRHKYRGYRIYAHNGGKFDFNFLAEKLKYSNRKLDFLMSSATCVQLSVYHNNEIDEDGNLLSRNCTRFVDSYRLLPYALDKLTKDFDVEHKKINFMPKGVKKKDFVYLNELFLKKDKHFYEYADNDSIGLYEVIKKFLQLLDKENGELGLTLASTSLKTFKKSYLNIPLKMTSKELNGEMKKAYYGGRTEIFKLYFPEGKYYCYDVNCFSNDTEILTRNGFKKYNDLKKGESILTLNTGNNKLEWNSIKYLHLHEYKGKLVNIKTENCDILVTPNHRIFYQDYNRNSKKKNYKTWSKFKVKEIKDLPMSYSRIPISGKYENGIKVYSNDMIKLFAWIITEGHFVKSSKGIYIYQSDKWNYHKEIKQILNNLGIPYSEKNRGKRKANYNSYEFYIKAKYGYIIRSLMNNKKEINREWLKTWDKNSLSILFWELLKGDGSFRNQKGKCTFVSVNKNDLDLMNEICLFIGKKSNINYKNHVVNIKLNSSGYFCSINNTKKDYVDYNNIVWCVTVKNSTCVIRRNGKICITGQSLYPFVMRNHYFPITVPRKIGDPNKEFITSEHGITKCKVTTPKDIDIPLLPYRYQNKLYFPTGTFTGYWDNVLLAKAYQLGYKIQPKKGFLFQSEKIFKEYVDRFYRLKQNSKKDTSPYILAKLLLNTLYGKFGQNQESDMLMKLTTENKKKFEIVDIIDLDHNLFKVKTESKGTHFIPQISIHVTALSQLELYKYFEMVKKKNGVTGYCDTDSLFTDCRLPCSNKLGDLKLEYSFKRGYFLLPKTYYVVGDKNKVKAKGFIKDFQDKLTENSYKKALFNNDYSDFVMESEPSFNTMKTSYRRHKTFLSVDKRKKSINHRYDKRRVLKDFTTKPKGIKEIIKNV